MLEGALVVRYAMKSQLLAQLILASMLSLGLSGCLDSNGSPAQTSAGPDDEPTGLVEPEPGVKVAENRGAVRGLVVNDAGLAIKSARATLIGTEFTKYTNGTGHFLMINVTVGTHMLRIESSSFKPFDHEVVVKAGEVANVTAQMVPKETSGAGYVDHPHDMWGEDTVKTLYNGLFDLRKSSEGNPGFGNVPYYTEMAGRPNTNSSVWEIPIAYVPDEPLLVYPGTREIRVTLSWNSQDVSLPKLGLAYAPASTSKVTFLEPKVSGSTWVIPVDSTTADSGHQLWTLWSFQIYAPNNYREAPNYTPAYVNGNADVKIEVEKGEIYLENAHKDFWNGEQTLVLQNRTKVYRSQTVCCQQRDGKGDTHMIKLPSPVIVPPGTKQIKMEYWVSYEGFNDPTPADFDHTLTWRTGEQNPTHTSIKDYKRANPIVDEPNHKVYVYDLDPKETDAFYQKKSNWAFAGWTRPFQEDGAWVDPRTRLAILEITVTRDPNFDAGAA
jgi:hypothetical protein